MEAITPPVPANPSLGAPAAGRRARRGAAGPALAAERLTKHFADRVAYHDVSFEVGAGEVFGFLGPNGAGKTTMVRTLTTLVAPSAGRACVAGVELDDANGVEIRSRIAVMTEAPGLYLRLSVADNLACFAALYGLDDRRGRIGRALASVRLTDRAGDLCGTLSKGMRQRVALARALLPEPEVLFLDEPTSGLDPASSHEVLTLLDDVRRRGATVFLTTHRLEEAERVCDRVAILATTLRTVGTPGELHDRLFTPSLEVRTARPLADPDATLAPLPGVRGWTSDRPNTYTVAVTDAGVVAPAVTRALVAAGADVLSISRPHHSLEDVYLQLVDPLQEATP